MRILVIDDSRFSRGVLRGLFEKVAPGCTVLEARDAIEAISTLRVEDQFDVITIDLHLPGTDGLALAEQLQARKIPGRKAVVCANYQESVQKRAGELGLTFVAKPFSAAKVESLTRPD